MKKRTLLIVIVLVVLLVSGLLLTQTALASRATGTSRVYHLTTLDWQVSGSSAANGYTLQSYAPQGTTGGGCCCTYLPCVRK